MAIFRWAKSNQPAAGRAPLSLAEARWKQGRVLLADLDNLSAAVPETRYENSFNNAKAAFSRGEFEIAAALLQEIRQAHADGHSRTLHETPQRTRRSRKDAQILAGRQAAIRRTLESFDEVIRALRATASREFEKDEAGDLAAAPIPAGQLGDFVRQFEAAEDAASRDQVLRRHFCRAPVNTIGDIKPGTLYAWRHAGAVTVLLTADHFPTASLIPVSDAVSGKRLRPLPSGDFLALGKRRQLVQLQPRRPRGAAGAAADGETTAVGDFIPLDIVAFNQLVLAAEQSGLISAIPVSNARDQFFRREKYHNAFGMIERLYQEFSAKAGERTAALKQEEEDYKRGRLKISPRQWQQKQRRDAAQTQRVERARKHFKLVLDGLRLLSLRQQQP